MDAIGCPVCLLGGDVHRKGSLMEPALWQVVTTTATATAGRPSATFGEPTAAKMDKAGGLGTTHSRDHGQGRRHWTCPVRLGGIYGRKLRGKARPWSVGARTQEPTKRDQCHHNTEIDGGKHRPSKSDSPPAREGLHLGGKPSGKELRIPQRRDNRQQPQLRVLRKAKLRETQHS